MNRKQIRLLVLLLAHRRVPFKVWREGAAWQISFDENWTEELRMAIGAGL